MPTARELLEQADALMRRNRTDDSEPDIPELTDEVAVAGTVLPVRASSKESPAAGERRRGQGGGRSEPDTDIADVGEPSMQSPHEHGGEDSRWLDADLGEASVTGPAPDSIAVVPPSTLRSPRGAGRTEAALPPLTESAQSRATDLPVGRGDPGAQCLRRTIARIGGNAAGQ